MAASVTVLKFGNSVLSDRSRLSSAVHDIYREVRNGQQVIAVVSAIGRHTDILLDEARHFGNRTDYDLALAKPLGTAAEQSTALLAMAVQSAGIPCALLEIEE